MASQATQSTWQTRWSQTVGNIDQRPIEEDTGLRDLIQLRCAAARVGASIDSLPFRERPLYQSFEKLFEDLEAHVGARFGRRMRERLVEAHDIQLAAGLGAIALIDAADLDAPAGILFHTCTVETTMTTGSRGVVRHPGGAKTVTYIFASLVGGTPGREYSHLILMDFAANPLDVAAIGRQAFDLAVRARQLTCELIDDVGPLPILGGMLDAAEIDAETSEIVQRGTAAGDIPSLVEHAAREGEPFVFAAFSNRTGDLCAPQGYSLDFSPLSGPDSERPGTCTGVMVRITEDICGRLLNPSDGVRAQLYVELPDRGGRASATKGGVIVPMSTGPHAVMAATYRPYEGGAAIALTNIGLGEHGKTCIADALCALFSGEQTRAPCRERAASFAQRFAISTRTPLGARTLAGFIVFAFAPTVPRRRSASTA